MSEYQYYEFQTADRRLTEKEMAELRKYSTRAKITPTSFTNEYSYGNFKGNEDLWMEKFFDGFLYTADWGMHRFDFAVPVEWIPEGVASLYCRTDAAWVRRVGKKLIFTFVSEDEGGESFDGEPINLSTLLGIRENIANGDFRGLYLAWLQAAGSCRVDDNEIEPPVPANLDDLPHHLSALVDFLRIDPDLLDAAARNSAKIQKNEPTPGEISKWIASLAAKTKDEMLVKVMRKEDSAIRAELRNRFTRERDSVKSADEAPRRTALALREAAEAEQ